jgi:Domain of unknown function (DUF222)
MTAEVSERGSGRGTGSPVVDAVTRAWTGPDARAAGVPASRIRPDAVVPGKAARWLLAAFGDEWARWDLAARTERAYREPGGPGPDAVKVTASGWVDASAWQLRGGLTGLGPEGFAQGGHGDGMVPGPLLGVLLEQAVTGGPESGTAAGVPVTRVEPGWEAAHREQAGGERTVGEPYADADAAAAASAGAGPSSLAGTPGVAGADGVRGLTSDELLGAMAAAQRLANRSEWIELAASAEFARRRHAEMQAAISRGDAAGQRAGEFFCEEVSWATSRSARQAEERVELAVSMAARLPDLGGRMAEGALDSYRLLVVHRATADLSAENARLIGAALAPDAPGLTPEALRKRAWRLALKLEPEAAANRKKKGKKKRRVEMWMEESGNAAFAGRELDPEDALAASAYYDAVAKMLSKGGVEGTMRELRHLAFVDRNIGRDPLDRIKGPDASDADAPRWQADDLRDDGYRGDEPAYGLDGLDDGSDDDEGDTGNDGSGDGNGGGPGAPGPAGTGSPSGGAAAPAGPAANIHLLVSAGTALGWSTEPGELSGFGPLDAQSARDLIRAAARNPATRWHVTLVDDKSGEAVAHACAHGPRPRVGQPPGQTGQTTETGQAGPPGRAEQAAQVGELLDRLGITAFEPIARGTCDHRHREGRYTPSRKLGDLIRARTATCPAPVCGASAVRNDLDHTEPWPAGPGTCECNLGPACRHHHRVKQAPGWRLDQAEPGAMRWTTPSGRVYETRSTVYDL